MPPFGVDVSPSRVSSKVVDLPKASRLNAMLAAIVLVPSPFLLPAKTRMQAPLVLVVHEFGEYELFIMAVDHTLDNRSQEGRVR